MRARAVTEIQREIHLAVCNIQSKAGDYQNICRFDGENENFQNRSSLFLFVSSSHHSVAVRLLSKIVMMRKWNKGSCATHCVRAIGIACSPFCFLNCYRACFLINLFFCLLERQRTGWRIRWTSERVSISHYFLIKFLTLWLYLYRNDYSIYNKTYPNFISNSEVLIF